MEHLLALIGIFILIFLPGAWLSFGLRLPALTFIPRLLIGAALSPLVILVQFYALRLVGVPFQTTCILLPLINLPALLLIRKYPEKKISIDWKVVAGALIVLSILLVASYPQWIYPSIRQFTGHGWWFTAPMYSVANGDLSLMDPDLPGMRLAYPWGGVIYQAIFSYLLGSPPVVSFLWTNLVWLLIIFALLIWIVKALGGGRFAQVSALVWLALGVNFSGFVLEKLAYGFGWNLPYIYGDPRYTPWLIKFLFLQQEPITLGIFSAVLLLLVTKWNGRLPAAVHWILVILLGEIALIQTIYVPAAAALIGAKIIALSYERIKDQQKPAVGELLWLAVDLLIAGVITILYVLFITRDRVAGSVGFFGGANVEGVKLLINRTSACLIALSLLLIGWLFFMPKLWKVQRQATIVLTLGAIASCILTILFHMPFSDEYKYIFTAAVCLTPFPSLALESWVDRSSRLTFRKYGSATILIGLTAILVIPLALRVGRGWPWWPAEGLVSPPPQTDLGHFDLELQADEPYAGPVAAIRQKTPFNTILVVQDPKQYLPVLTQRAWYVAPRQYQPFAGVNVPLQFYLLEVKGYDPGTIEARLQDLQRLFQPQEAGQIESSLQNMLSLNSPLAVILQVEQDKALHEWLEEHQAGEIIYTANNTEVWLIN
jgi:hypothetical protein